MSSTTPLSWACAITAVVRRSTSDSDARVNRAGGRRDRLRRWARRRPRSPRKIGRGTNPPARRRARDAREGTVSARKRRGGSRGGRRRVPVVQFLRAESWMAFLATARVERGRVAPWTSRLRARRGRRRRRPRAGDARGADPSSCSSLATHRGMRSTRPGRSREKPPAGENRGGSSRPKNGIVHNAREFHRLDFAGASS